MTITHYEGSRGPVEIATMPLPYASNALAKLQRERTNDSRDQEIEALAAHVARLSEEVAERQALEALDPEPAPAAEAEVALDTSDILL